MPYVVCGRPRGGLMVRSVTRFRNWYERLSTANEAARLIKAITGFDFWIEDERGARYEIDAPYTEKAAR